MAERREPDDEDLPDIPPVPDLPEPPRLKPNLPPRPRERDSEERSQYNQMGLAYSIPASLAAPIIVLTLIGVWLDSRFHAQPWFTLGGALLGMITGLINMLRIVNKLNR